MTDKFSISFETNHWFRTSRSSLIRLSRPLSLSVGDDDQRNYSAGTEIEPGVERLWEGATPRPVEWERCDGTSKPSTCNGISREGRVDGAVTSKLKIPALRAGR
ncbi:hypothetical protein EVAR_82135_1 [Eumeta japonica]|uniref:Uncharacterized protein n=1 Tax=Eumeta variegata TaxID=151549 RepID=A0A4C1U1S3_EUMVA|nr:hypothetical protein EVAR_82135_1 [Eumeta japonica]